MQVSGDNRSEEGLSEYQKRGYEHVEEEKAILDEIVMLYRKRQEITQNYLRALEELHSTANAKFDSNISLYGSFASPILDSLEEDIKSYRQYVQDSEKDLSKITFDVGSSDIVEAMKRDMGAVRTLYSEYTTLFLSVLQLPRPPPPRIQGESLNWPYQEDIQHRQATAKLHTKQRDARMHFKTTYPKLLDDHMEYIEQVKRFSLSNTTRRRLLSATIKFNASREEMLVGRAWTMDAIAMPRCKMLREKYRRKYRHAPVLNVLTGEMGEGRTVIVGREIELGWEDDAVQKVIVACLERLPKTNWGGLDNAGWEYYWRIILAMELNSSEQAIHDTISKIQNRINLYSLVDIIVANTRMSPLLLAIIDEEAMMRLKKNKWDRPALKHVMKDLDPRLQRIFKACAIARITGVLFYQDICTLLHNWIGVGTWDDNAMDAIFRMWDHELWRPLPDDVEWRAGRNNGELCVCRMKRFHAKRGYGGDGWSSGWVWLEVDENGDVLDTPDNKPLKQWIQKEPIGREPKTRLSKSLQKLNV